MYWKMTIVPCICGLIFSCLLLSMVFRYLAGCSRRPRVQKDPVGYSVEHYLRLSWLYALENRTIFLFLFIAMEQISTNYISEPVSHGIMKSPLGHWTGPLVIEDFPVEKVALDTSNLVVSTKILNNVSLQLSNLCLHIYRLEINSYGKDLTVFIWK
jgi:hypothetical protein